MMETRNFMTDREKTKSDLETGKTVLGIEFGSTRIKAVLIISFSPKNIVRLYKSLI